MGFKEIALAEGQKVMAAANGDALAEGYGRPRLEWLLKGHRSAGQDAVKIVKWRQETLGSLRRRPTQNNPHGLNQPALRWDRGPAKLIAKYRLDLGGKTRLRPRLEGTGQRCTAWCSGPP